jgi:hypothetical protein
VVVRRWCPRGGREFVHCELTDGTVCAVPAWMTDAATCTGHELGPAQVSVDTLEELRRVLDAVAVSHAVPEAAHKHGQR